jgi:hypothetical protein
MRKKTLIDKKAKKRLDKKCHFCNEDDYDLLDVHRIVEGKDGGRYTDFNTVTTCSKCHRKIHSGRIEIKGKYSSTAAKYVINYIEDGEEKWA